jgi:hypothetical protein
VRNGERLNTVGSERDTTITAELRLRKVVESTLGTTTFECRTTFDTELGRLVILGIAARTTHLPTLEECILYILLARLGDHPSRDRVQRVGRFGSRRRGQITAL